MIYGALLYEMKPLTYSDRQTEMRKTDNKGSLYKTVVNKLKVGDGRCTLKSFWGADGAEYGTGLEGGGHPLVPISIEKQTSNSI